MEVLESFNALSNVLQWLADMLIDLSLFFEVSLCINMAPTLGLVAFKV